MTDHYTLTYEAPERRAIHAPGEKERRFHFENHDLRYSIKNVMRRMRLPFEIRLAHSETVDGMRRTTYSVTCPPEMAERLREVIADLPSWRLAPGQAKRKQGIKPSRVGKTPTTIYSEPDFHARFKKEAARLDLTVEAAIKRAMETWLGGPSR